MNQPPMQQQPAAPAQDVANLKPRLIPGSDETDAELDASPQEQADLEQFVSKAMMMIHGQKSRDQTVQALHNPRDPMPQTIGRITANIIETIAKQKAAADQQPVDKDLMREAAGYVVPELVEVASAAGLIDMEVPQEGEVGGGDTPFDELVRLSMLEAVKAYGERKLREPGAEAEVEAAGDEWAQQVAAEVQSGQADPEYMAMARPQQLIPTGGEA